MMEKQSTDENKRENPGGISSDDEKPPVLSSWNQLYAIVLLNLIILIVLFYIFTQTFS